MKLTDEQKQLVNEYRQHITNTGGNEIVELCERTDINLFNNAPTTLLQSCVQAQVWLLQNLKDAGALKQ